MCWVASNKGKILDTKSPNKHSDALAKTKGNVHISTLDDCFHKKKKCMYFSWNAIDLINYCTTRKNLLKKYRHKYNY